MPIHARAAQPDLKLLSDPLAHRHQEQLNAPSENLTLMQAATFYCLPLQPHKADPGVKVQSLKLPVLKVLRRQAAPLCIRL